MSNSRLFKPLKLGNIQINNRVAMAPLTRFRATDDHIPMPIVADYYAQRASVPGTLLITEATFISQQAGGYANAPGIWNQAQIDAWKNVTEAVHKKGSYIFLQLWALGRVADKAQAEKEGIVVKGPSPLPLDENSAVPKEMTREDMNTYIASYTQAAKNAIAAGFDGVEIHNANGYLLDQFLQDTVNSRTDEYGGSVENRSRFPLEVAQAVADAVGVERTGIRLSPFSTFQGMRMADPYPQFTDYIKKLNTINGKGLAYVHLVESRISGNADVEASYSLHPLTDVWDGPFLVAGGFKPDSAKRAVDEEYPNRDVVVVFGRYFISTPDLVYRLREGIELNPYNRETFYAPKIKEGYLDYPFSREYLNSLATPAATP